MTREEYERLMNSDRISGLNDDNSRNPWPEEPKRRFRFKHAVYALLAFFVLSFGYNWLSGCYVKYKNNIARDEIRKPDKDVTDASCPSDSMRLVPERRLAEKEHERALSGAPAANPAVAPTPRHAESGAGNKPRHGHRASGNAAAPGGDAYDGMSTLEVLERTAHADAVRTAREYGVSTKGSTLDILERISHADAVRSAREHGVSTKGSTLDILERISHADAVRSAREHGVSTKGSTLDILERISHADAVRSAREHGVSTKGSAYE